MKRLSSVSLSHGAVTGTGIHTLDKSRRRDALFPQSLELQAYHSDCLWLAISHVFSCLGKKKRESLYSVKSYSRYRTKVD